MATTTATQIQQLYVGLLGRAADQGGLNWWADQVTTGGKTLEDVRASFVTSTEYTTTYGAAATRADLVTSIYQNLFERTPSADEVKYWAETDTRPADQLVAAFIEFAGAADQAVINNKTFVAQTYTDTAGADFNAEGAAAVIANVDGTPASVAAAIAAIANGTLEGQVPGVTQIEALSVAKDALAAFEDANTAAADALVAKLDAAGGAKSGAIDPAVDSYQAKVTAVVSDATAARNLAGEATNVLEAKVVAAAALVTADYKLLSSTEKPLADKYVAAIAAEAVAKAGAASLTEMTGAVAAFGVDATATAALTAHGGTAEELYSEYVNATGPDRADIDAEFASSNTYAAFKASAVKDAAYADAIKATLTAEDNLDSNNAASTVTAAGFDTAADTINGVEVAAPAADTATTSTAAADTYIGHLGAKAEADAAVVVAKAADVNLTAATALEEAYKAQTDAVQTAQDKVDAVDVAGKVATHDLDGYDTAGTGTVAAPIKDVFYFGDKSVATDDANDFSITSFAAGDSIVLGSSTYTFNNGALSTGDNNKLEFFLVKSGSDLQIVLETAKYGSDDLTTNATTGAVTSTTGDHAAVITLTGVALADVTVNNGVISHVA